MYCLSLLYFLKVNFRFQKNYAMFCHYLIQKTIISNNFAIIFVKGIDYTTYCWYISEDEAMNIMKDSDLS